MATQLHNLNQSAPSTTVTLPNVMIYGAEWVWTIFTHSSSWVFSASTLAPLTLQSGAAAPSPLQEQSCTSFTTARAELQLLYHCKNWTAVTSLLQELFHSYFTAARTELQLLHCCKNGTAVTVLLKELTRYTIFTLAGSEQRCRKKEALQLNLGYIPILSMMWPWPMIKGQNIPL